MALDPGNVVQNAIYLSGGTPWPVGAGAWEARAKELLEQGPYDYVAGGAGAEETMRVNLEAFGRRALQQIRCRLVDRIGELAQVPCFRFVYLDADPETMKRAASGPPDAVLMAEHVFHAPLQPVTAYRRRQLGCPGRMRPARGTDLAAITSLGTFL